MDSTMYPPATSTPGVLHYIPPNLSAFEPAKPSVASNNLNTLLWIGGMFDTFHSVQYPFLIAQCLGPTWSLLTASLSSAGLAWGVGSISRDAEDMANIVRFIQGRKPGGKVVIMGHSTGCQDCMEYLVGSGAKERPAVHGIILQAPVSDRLALSQELPEAIKYEADQLALHMCEDGREKDCLPNRLTGPVFGRLAITARRWIDISSPGPDHSGADDFFSSDLPVERLRGTFGRLNPSTPLLVLYSGDDESVPQSVDKQKLMQTWRDVVKDGVMDEESGILMGASHNLNGSDETVVQELIRRVVAFLSRLEEMSGGASRI
jgi:pimeloyl-ACP methyl ester carboxylesterase